jgi:hypothetical protein
MQQTKISSSQGDVLSEALAISIHSSSSSKIEAENAQPSSPEGTSTESKAVSTEDGTKVLSSSTSLKPSRRLVDILVEIKSFPEFAARSLFKGILNELEKLHAQKQYHGNLALETISLTYDHEIILSEPLVEDGKPFSKGILVDMFCLGEILFSLITGFFPFASEEDPNFLAYLEANWEQFWEAAEKNMTASHHTGSFFSGELRDVIASLMSMRFGPELFFNQINEYQWLKGVDISLKQTGELLSEVRKKLIKIAF